MAGAASWTTLLRPGPRRALQALLDGAQTLTALAEATGLSKPSLLPHLRELAALGLIEAQRISTPTGWENRYVLLSGSLHVSIDGATRTVVAWGSAGRWDPGAPLVAQVPQAQVRAEVAAFLHSLARQAPELARECAVILFGSGARGEATWKSDVDLIVLTSARDARAAIDAASVDASVGAQHAVVATVATAEEFASGRKRMFAEAAREGMIVWAPRGDLAPWTKMARYKAISL